jgi:hypothetical protein
MTEIEHEDSSLWDVTRCRWTSDSDVSKDISVCIFSLTEDEDIMIFRNVENCLPNDTALTSQKTSLATPL